MKRPHRSEDGTYTVKGKKYKELFGSREQVVNGTAYKTTGGLTVSQLTMNKWGRIVSTLKHNTAKKEKRLQKYGYYSKKGKFGYVKKTVRKTRSLRKIKGGNQPPFTIPSIPAINSESNVSNADPDALSKQLAHP